MDYLDVNAVANLLHVLPKQVQRWAERGHIPAQKINGEWRFARAAVHQWIEDKLHDLDGQQQMDEVVKHHLVSIAEQLPIEAIAIPLNARTPSSVIDELSKVAASTGLLWDADEMAKAVRQREEIASTALECGVSLMHPRRPLTNYLAEPFIALGITAKPFPMSLAGENDSCLVDVFFLLCSMDDVDHIRTLARLGRLIRQPDFLPDLRSAQSPAEVLDVIREAESKIRQ
ncbi:MAG: PTS sugar transporter subunit IIA [Thermoguttaceae bacterium]|jgi:PTS system nitrogen regulatory IIA component|nr:PTS sugar transporter subunit IIA [Thermoguttaceae bacterium]MBQ6616007.1 PTS sugar transporter subunit IIA [Thermoguttaceae bacterium]